MARLPQFQIFSDLEGFDNIIMQLTLLNFDTLLLQQIPQSKDFFLKLSNQFGVCILIDNSLANNLFCTIRIPGILLLVLLITNSNFCCHCITRSEPNVSKIYLYTYLNVERVSSQLISAGEMAAIMAVLEFPPRFSRRIHVKTESRYGTKVSFRNTFVPVEWMFIHYTQCKTGIK